MEQRGPEADDLLLDLVEVGDIEVQMKLLRVRGVRPLRGAEVLHTLKREHEA